MSELQTTLSQRRHMHIKLHERRQANVMFIVPADRPFIPAFYLLIILLLWLLPTEYQKQNFRYRSYNFLLWPSTHPSYHQNDGMHRLSIQIPHTLFLPVQVITCRSPSTPSQDSPDLLPFLRHTEKVYLSDIGIMTNIRSRYSSHLAMDNLIRHFPMGICR